MRRMGRSMRSIMFAAYLIVCGIILWSNITNTTVLAATSGSSFLNAVSVEVNKTCKVIDAGNGGEYFKFVPGASGKYTFQSSLYNNGDPKIKVYNANQQQLGYNDDGGEYYNFKLEIYLERGKTYYIYAYGVRGDGYVMTVSYKDWSLSNTTVSLGANQSTYTIYAYDCEVSSVASSNKNVATAYINDAYSNETEIIIKKTGIGSAQITITASDGTRKICTVQCAYAPFSMSKSSLVFDKKIPYSCYYVYPNNYETSIVSAVSSNSKIATVTAYNYSSVCITPKKAGKTTITVKDNLGRTTTVSVVVKKNWFKENLKYNTYVGLAYGSKKMYVSSKQGAKVTVKIDGKTYKTKIGKKGYQYIKVNKLHKLNSKMKVTVEYKKNKVTLTRKVYSRTWAYKQTIWSCQYTIPIKAYYVTKGDTIMLTAGGKTYKKKVGKSADSAEYVFTTKYQNRNYSTIRIRIKNKFNQKLYDNTTNIRWR